MFGALASCFGPLLVIVVMSVDSLAADFLWCGYVGPFANRLQLAERCVQSGLLRVGHFDNLSPSRFEELTCCMWPEDVVFVRKLAETATLHCLGFEDAGHV